jgi:signal transduction histidine kinase
MNLTMVRETLTSVEPDLARTRGLVDHARDHVREAIAELRDLARGIHPPVLDNGLGDALTTLAAGSAIPVRLKVFLPERPSAAIETIAYFCAAELVTNAIRHGGATHVGVAVDQPNGRLRMRVTDDGRGGARPNLTARPAGGGSGLAGLVERVRAVDGNLGIDSPPGGPTVVTVDLPLRV